MVYVERDVQLGLRSLGLQLCPTSIPLYSVGTLFPTLSVVGDDEQPVVSWWLGGLFFSTWEVARRCVHHLAQCPLPSMPGEGWTGRDWTGRDWAGSWAVGKWPSVRGTRCHACPHGLLVDAGCASETGRQRIEPVCTMQVFWFNTGASCGRGGRGQGFRGIYARKDSGETVQRGAWGPRSFQVDSLIRGYSRHQAAWKGSGCGI